MSTAVDIIQSFAAKNDLFNAELEDSDGGVENGVPSYSEEKPSSPAQNEGSTDENEASGDESAMKDGNSSEDFELHIDEDEEDISKAPRRSRSFAANNNLFDAELEDSYGGTENGIPLDAEEKPSSPAQNEDSTVENEASGDENSMKDGNSSEDSKLHIDENEESINKVPRRSRSPKPRKMKKAAIQMIHSESQRMVRESLLKLPYHQPEAKPISHFLRRVPVIKEDVKKPSKHLGKVSPEMLSTTHDVDNDPEEPSSTPVVTTPENAADTTKTVTPKLTSADDPFFFDETPTAKLPNKGVQSLMARFMKHTTKPSPKINKVEKPKVVEPVMKREETAAPINSPVVPLIPENKVEKCTPGSRLKVLKEQLENKMKLQRAKQRQIHESQRKLDNEELSEEEEEEMTDEESDSDYEVNKWDEIDERKQEEGSDTEENGNKRETSAFIDDEADEDYDDGNYGDVDSGSEGDVSDEGNSDDDNSVFSDTKLTKKSKSKKLKKLSKSVVKPVIHSYDEHTLDLFGSDSRSQTGSETSKIIADDKEANAKKQRRNSDESSQGLCLRLDSLEEDDDEVELTKLKEFKSPAPVTTAETSQDSSQSSLGLRIASDLDGSNESSRIPAAQGDSTGQNLRADSTTPELFSLFPRIAENMRSKSDGTQQDNEKKPGKLSQLTLPVEDSQDLFENDTEKGKESTQVVVSNDFHFSLDEDTQFTQMLDTQGYLFSSKKPRKPTKTSLVFDGPPTKDSDTMDEILGLCSGQFSGGNTGTIPNRSTATQDPKSVFKSQGSNMDELLGLCSGKFEDDEPERTWKGKEFSFSGALKEDKSDVAMESGNEADVKEDEEEGTEKEDEGEVTEKEDEGQTEEEVDEKAFNNKYGKTYGKKVFNKMNFLEEEAELSGSDVGSDEDDDINTDDDELEEESDQEELPSDEELQKQINKVHIKSMLDQDKAEIRLMKEMYLQDGDLYTDGEGRKRNFRWRGIDENSQLELFDKRLWGEEDGQNVELLTEEESKRRKERFERDTFLRDEMSKSNKGSLVDMDENSQSILNIIKDTSSTTAVTPKEQQQNTKLTKSASVPKLQRASSQKGSFLNRSKATLNRLSSITANKPNASVSGRTFVFQSVSAADKEKAGNPKKMPRTVSMIEPVAKRPKLDRSMSETPSGSIFAML